MSAIAVGRVGLPLSGLHLSRIPALDRLGDIRRRRRHGALNPLGEA